MQAGYKKRDDGLIDVHNSQLNPFSGKVDSVKGNAECNGSKCLVGFFIIRDGDYQVIDTDYINYTIVYSCDTWFFFFRYEVVWAMTRA